MIDNLRMEFGVSSFRRFRTFRWLAQQSAVIIRFTVFIKSECFSERYFSATLCFETLLLKSLLWNSDSNWISFQYRTHYSYPYSIFYEIHESSNERVFSKKKIRERERERERERRGGRDFDSRFPSIFLCSPSIKSLLGESLQEDKEHGVWTEDRDPERIEERNKGLESPRSLVKLLGGPVCVKTTFWNLWIYQILFKMFP